MSKVLDLVAVETYPLDPEGALVPRLGVLVCAGVETCADGCVDVKAGTRGDGCAIEAATCAECRVLKRTVLPNQ